MHRMIPGQLVKVSMPSHKAYRTYIVVYVDDRIVSLLTATGAEWDHIEEYTWSHDTFRHMRPEIIRAAP